MALHTIQRGLDLPIVGTPDQKLHDGPRVGRVALVAADYLGLRPTMLCELGDTVRRGQPVFEDRKVPGVAFTAPGAGTVVGVHRGDRRALLSVVIELNEREQAGKPHQDDLRPFNAYSGRPVAALSREDVVALLTESGLWTALRTRPFSKIPDPATTPQALFVTTIDTQPLAPSVGVVLKGNEEAFEIGLSAIAKLSGGKTFVCCAAGLHVPIPASDAIMREDFEGPHPAGTPGLHIHLLHPAHRDKAVWHIDYQDVIAVGHLVKTGELNVSRVISVAGPVVRNPRLIRTRLGASIDDLTRGELSDGDNRVISGSVLSGRTASGDAIGYLGRYHSQITALREGHNREFLGWLMPGKEKFSVINLFLSRLFPGKRFSFTTTMNGGRRAMVPLGVYEKVMPMDILPTFLLRALVMRDLERSEQLGCLELDEEDLALCTFVCPSKYDYGVHLRAVLDEIEKEG